MNGQLCTNTQRSVLHPNCNTLELERPHHDRPIVCVIAQQYSSNTFFSMPFHSRK